MKRIPKVSIVSITYNQEKFVGEAIESFLVQQTEFEIEIIISDDASSDSTQEIIRDYKKRFPAIIKTNLRKKNVGVEENFYSALKEARGEFIALCEGDDYWTDPSKLQRQVDFFEGNRGYSLCFHPVRVFFENNEKKDYIFPSFTDGFTVPRLLKSNFIQTNSVMYRRQDYRGIKKNILPADHYMHLFHAQYGKIGFINRVMSDYRRHPGGVWWSAYDDKTKFWEKYMDKHMELYRELLVMYGENIAYREIIISKVKEVVDQIVSLNNTTSIEILKQFKIKYPDLLRLV